MDKQNFTITFLVDKTPAEVFDAITNVRGWWSEVLEGNSEKLGDEFVYEHPPFHFSKQRLIEVIADQKVVWLVTDSKLTFTEDQSEWTNTQVIFEVSKNGDKTQLNFTHAGLVPEIECYENCTKGWNYYLKNSLLQLIETGTGQPDKKKSELVS